MRAIFLTRESSGSPSALIRGATWRRALSVRRASLDTVALENGYLVNTTGELTQVMERFCREPALAAALSPARSTTTEWDALRLARALEGVL